MMNSKGLTFGHNQGSLNHATCFVPEEGVCAVQSKNSSFSLRLQNCCPYEKMMLRSGSCGEEDKDFDFYVSIVLNSQSLKNMTRSTITWKEQNS